MENIIELIQTYEVLKKDLHTLLIKGSITPLDYEGKVEFRDTSTTALRYKYCNSNTAEEADKACSLLEGMIKTDLRIWDKTQGVEGITAVVVDNDCGETELVCMVDYLS